MSSLISASVVAVLFLSTFSVATSEPITYRNCGSESDRTIEVTNFFSSPDPPEHGTAVTFTAEVELREDVNGGRVEIQAIGRGELKYYKPELISHNLCSLMPNGCPIEKGKTSISVTQGIASDVPVGPYEMEIKAYDEDDGPLLCANVNFDLSE